MSETNRSDKAVLAAADAGGDWHSRGGRRRGKGRLFDSGELRLLVLKLISERPRHGYDLIRSIEELASGAYAPSPGVVYPTLTLLGEMELIAEDESDGARKLYAITPLGKANLIESEAQIDALISRLRGLSDEQNRSNNGPVRRAMGNLKVVLMERLRGGEVSDDLPHDIAAILDEAARKIERL
jgi:DNA-binding PadR family transcriptional regulator